ncbi:MAG: type II secretion system protein [Methylobacter sp.]|uniref:type II secretion system protein n=1 Tax=Methylobacter sp. TaxID=2051955 RepID=UPI002731DFAA|nr:type II secretion system protein [Methylobacter sp.]MDP1665301.1 type II secretion system protein [Methylobacter sp.]
MMRIQNRMQGFTLIELLMVIVITGILAPVIATFIKQPVDAYFNSVRRAALTDEADTAIRRMARDIHKALPNSIRNPDNNCIEFIPTKTGGRYRASGNGDFLDFTALDTSFDMFGLNIALPADQKIAAGDMIAVYNLGMTGANAYNAENTATVASVGDGDLPGEAKITFTASKQFPLASSSHRFHVIPANEKIVSFVCSGGELYRTSNYAYTDSCSTIGGALLAQHVTSCTFAYNNFDMQRNGLVRMTITLTDDSGESVSLYHEAHVDNSP